MKTLLLTLSLAANAVLAIALIRAPDAATVARNSTPETASLAHSVAPAPATAIPVANLWVRLHSDNFDELNRRLRAAGFPPKAVRALLAEAINDEATARREALLGKEADVPYWRLRAQTGREVPVHDMVEISTDTAELLYKFVNGPDSFAENEEALIAAKRRFGDLPLEKLQQVAARQHEVDLKRAEEYAAVNGQPWTEAIARATSEKMRALDAEQANAVGKLLTPDELEQYELHNDAGGLRMTLASFQPTEAEFKALYALQKQWGPATTPDQRIAQAQSVLSADRYAEFAVLGTSDGTGKLGELMSRLNLPLTTIPTVNAVRDDINQRAKAVNNDPGLTADERSAQLAVLAQEANDKLTSTLGPRGYAAYSDLKGDWIRALKPRRK